MATATDTVRGARDEAPASAGIGAVGLVVRDLAATARFYEEVVGLGLLSRAAGEASLGVDGRTLVHLREDREAEPDDPRSAGLFHTAFLLPSRESLGRWLRHAADVRVPLEGASDHLVSEAIYLSDPEGNGIEVYADRPRDQWTRSDGEIEMASLALDLREVAAAAEGPWEGAPAGTTVGHIHLRVGSMDQAEAFYHRVLGLDVVNSRYPGARFFSRAGYHHHVGTNIWRSRGAQLRDGRRAGLDWFELTLDDEAYGVALSRLEAGQDAATEADDPWGTRIRLLRAA